jgi:hypothetical protein
MNDKQKQWLMWGVLAALIAVAGFFGVILPIPMPPVPSSAPQALATAQYATKCRFENGGGKITCASGGTLEMQSGSTLDVQSGATVGNLSSTGVITAGSLGLNGVRVSGPYKFGCSAAGLAQDGTIAHGLGTTPTVALLTSLIPSAGSVITTGVYISATNTTSITVGLIYPEATAPKVCWLAGK